jgi:branched-chain amino acid transport system substrate-binding protein
MKAKLRLSPKTLFCAMCLSCLVAAVPSLSTFAIAQDTFNIGALNPITGAGSFYGSGMQQTILFAADQVNAAGGAGGRTLKVFAEDTQTQPEAAVLAAKKLIEVNKVQAILGTWSSSVTLAVMPLTEAANIILMHNSGAPEITTENKKGLVWRFAPSQNLYGRVFAEVCRKNGFKRPATMALNNASALGQIQVFSKTWKAMGGNIVESVVYEPKMPTYRSELEKVLAAKPDVIILGSYLPDTTILLREWYQTGINTKWIIPQWAATPKLIEALGENVTEGIITIFRQENTSPAFVTYSDLYKKATGKSGSDNLYAAMCYDMVNVLALAMEAAGPGASVLQINSKIRTVADGPGTEVYSFAEGKKALKKGPINYNGAGSWIDLDKFGDDAGSIFTWSVIQKGRYEKKGNIILK